MDIRTEQVDRVSAVSPSGRLDSTGSGAVMDKLNEIVTAIAPRVVLDLSKLDYISSAGLRSVLVAAKLGHSRKGELRLCAASPGVEKVFTTSGFTKLIRLDPDVATVVAALRQG